MNAPRRVYRSPARAAAAAETRAGLVRAFAQQLGQPGATTFSVAAAAAAAGVALRTAHHHFPDHASRLAAVVTWVEERLGPRVPDPTSAADIPAFVRAAYRRAGRDLSLTRAMLTSSLGDQVRRARLSARRTRLRELIEELGAPPRATAHAAAVIALLASSEAGIPLVDVHGLSVEAAGEAAATACAAILAALPGPRAGGRATRPSRRR